MKILLDTHAAVWWWTNDDRLSNAAHAAIADATVTVLVSAVTAWELSTKHRIGKWSEAGLLVERMDQLVRDDRFQALPITLAHARRAGALDWPHKDPFDRLLAAQAELEGVSLVTRDQAFRSLSVDVLWDARQTR